MFTSRAEYRILLRQDNADIRLTEKSFNIGLADQRRYDVLKRKEVILKNLNLLMGSCSVTPAQINEKLKELNTTEIKQSVKLKDIVLRPQVKIKDIVEFIPELKGAVLEIEVELRNEIVEAVEIELKYSGYIEREKIIAEKIKRLESIRLSDDLDYDKFLSVSTEARQKLNKIRPKTIGQASRISGVSPSDINVLLVYLGR
jgi:tRNA uridine 5-carboxymethylaminomethyl modification enzyme